MKKILTLILLGFFVFQVSATPKLEVKHDIVKTEMVKQHKSYNDAVEVARVAVSETVKNGTSAEKAVIKCIKKTPIRIPGGYNMIQVSACVDVDGTLISVNGQYHPTGEEYIVLAEVDSTCRCN